jgi:nicotinate phosphoribosyltransferase
MLEAEQSSAMRASSFEPDGQEKIGLLTDLYELTMAEGYWRSGLAEMEACFTAFFRENPYGGGFTLVCGTSQLASLVENFHYSQADIAYLRNLQAPAGGPLFSAEFLEWLADWRPRVTIDALRDGDLAFPREPVVRVCGPIIDCQLLESPLLNLVNFETLVATKAARVCLSAQGRPVAEFGLRRAQGPDGALSASRAAYVGGCASTSNLLAAKRYGIPASGTHAHAWVMAFPDELSAFRAYAQVSPNNCTLLVDTYDVMGGVDNAIIVGKEMEQRGQRLAAIRIDSGDLCALSQRARAKLDEAGLPYVKIIVSNDLDEHLIESLFLQGARVDGFGVGTKLVTCFDQPALSGVYKLSAKRMPGQEWTPVLKVSEQVYKRTIPGVQDVRRFFDETGTPVADMICSQDFPHDAQATIVDVNDPLLTRSIEGLRCQDMLCPVTVGGLRAAEPEDLACARARAAANIATLKPASKRLLNPQVYPVGLERGLSDLRQSMIAQARSTQNDLTWR